MHRTRLLSTTVALAAILLLTITSVAAAGHGHLLRRYDNIWIDHLGVDSFTATPVHRDLIFGLGGADSLISGDKRDTVHAGRGSDKVASGDGRDRVFGGRGNDAIDSGEGPDLLFGGPGADMITGARRIQSHRDAALRRNHHLPSRQGSEVVRRHVKSGVEIALGNPDRSSQDREGRDIRAVPCG